MNLQVSSPAGLEAPTRVRYGVLGFACSLSMITYLDRVCFGTVAPHIQSEFDLSDYQKGLLFSAFALAYALFEVPSGRLGDLYGPRRTLICSAPAARGGETVHWRHAFWLFGVLGVAWCVVFWWWFSDYPEQKPGVNRAELALIRGETPQLPPLSPEGEKIVGRWHSPAGG